MVVNTKVPRSRRNFLVQCSGILAGLLAPIHVIAANPKKEFKNILQSLEMENLQRARPLQNRSEHLPWVAAESRISNTGIAEPAEAIRLNPTAEHIWHACNGRSTPSDIARMLCNRFAVSYPQAYADTLCFLVELKNRNLIRLQ
jgi:hypothetical protein